MAGGYDQNYNSLRSTELFDPATNTWSPGGNMASVHYGRLHAH